MSRAFDGIDDVIDFSPGTLTTLDGGPITVAWIWKPAALHNGGILWANGAGQVALINPFNDGRIYVSFNGFTATETYTGGTDWFMLAITKANGSAVVRGHTFAYTGGTWTHTDYGSINDSANGPVSLLRVGRNDTTNEYLHASVAVMGIWLSVLPDLTLEGMTASLGSWISQSPDALWAFNQTSVATPVPDTTGHGADQSAITGTSVDADEPPGWSYSVDGAASLAAEGSMTADASIEAMAAASLSSTATLTAEPATALGYDPVRPLGQALLDCLCEKVSLIPNPPQNCCFRLGIEVAHDADLFTDMCCEGLAYVRLGEVYPSTDGFPDEDVTRQATVNCGIGGWAVQLFMGIIRCAPMGTNTSMPTCEEYTAAAVQNFVDSQALRATACCFIESVRNTELLLGYHAIIGRQTQGTILGGCIERSQVITVQVPNCDCG